MRLSEEERVSTEIEEDGAGQRLSGPRDFLPVSRTSAAEPATVDSLSHFSPLDWSGGLYGYK
jgi:hypothetical protein